MGDVLTAQWCLGSAVSLGDGPNLVKSHLDVCQHRADVADQSCRPGDMEQSVWEPGGAPAQQLLGETSALHGTGQGHRGLDPDALTASHRFRAHDRADRDTGAARAGSWAGGALAPPCEGWHSSCPEAQLPVASGREGAA